MVNDMSLKLVDRAIDRLRAPDGAVAAVSQSRGTAATAWQVLLAPPPVPVDMAEARQVVIDLTRLDEAGLVTPAGARTRIAQEFRAIKTPLLERASVRGHDSASGGNIIMVTSPAPGEAKTSTAINLAMSIAAERDLRVLLIDADGRRPSLMTALGLHEEKGFLDVLAGTGFALEDAILRTNVPRLSLMASGAVGPNAAELLAGARASAMIEEMSHRYGDRMIVFSAPSGPVAKEVAMLARYAGQAVVAVNAGTDRRALDDTLRLVRACAHAEVVSVG
jgi:protein-tyrosine kinase